MPRKPQATFRLKDSGKEWQRLRRRYASELPLLIRRCLQTLERQMSPQTAVEDFVHACHATRAQQPQDLEA